MMCPCCNTELPEYKYYDEELGRCRPVVMR